MRVTVHGDRIEIVLVGDEDVILLPWSQQTLRRKRELIIPLRAEPDRDLRPMKSEDRTRILKGIARARIWLQELSAGEIADTDALAARERCTERSVRMMLSLAFLSPPIVEAIIAGQLPRGIGMRQLAALPTAWSEQHATLGF